ncbi:MAG TPA: NADH-quinone oxidoreductase subunit NuoG [Bacteroidales bacterium]|nr:NADH-quinone oxidoreductase subunit NuoG [Bacteroidales bacterium]
MATIIVDGKQYQAEAGDNLLKACIKLGIDIPYFCYHPALGSVGSCRLCAVKRFRDADDKRGRIVMSCMEPVSEGMIISVNDEEVKNFRASVIEGLMTNHPHDCPVCDEGGECHLQDMTVMTGHNNRRFEFKKRTQKNQNLGPFIHHEMNRCIQCYRCVRYYRDYAGGKDFGVFGSHNHLYFGRFEDGQLESEFSGNLVEVCPTGVFTDKTLKKHFTRKWDLTNAPSLCTHCGVGCNTIVSERYGTVRRVMNRYNHHVNGYFLCDKGRFGYEFVNDPSRITVSSYKGKALDVESALLKATELIRSGKTIGVGSPVASLEANFALQQLVGAENFYAGVSKAQWELVCAVRDIYRSKNVKTLSLAEVEKAEGVLILGENIINTAPRAALSVRQAVKNKPFAGAAALNIADWNNSAVKIAVGTEKGPLYIFASGKNKLEDVASISKDIDTAYVEKIAEAIAASLKGNLNTVSLNEDEKATVKQITDNLLSCKKVAVISGTSSMSKKLLALSAEIASLLNTSSCESGIYLVVPHANSLGLAVLTSNTIEQVADAAENVVLLEANSIEESVITFSEKAKNVIVLVYKSPEKLNSKALVLASATFAESEGTLVNNEGRMQRYFRVKNTGEDVKASWMWLSQLKAMLDNSNYLSFDSLVKKIGESYPELNKIVDVAPGAGYRESAMKIPRQTPRFTGRTSMYANVDLHEQKPQNDENSALAFTMEGSREVHPAQLNAIYWKPGWNSVQATNHYLRDLDNILKAQQMGINIWNVEK